MSKKLLFAAIASILATGAYATSATVTSKDYVDNTFQTKIPANSFTAFGEGMPSLLSTTDTDGVTGEIGLVTTSVSGIEAPDYYSYNEVFDRAVPSFAQVQLMIYRDIANSAGLPTGTPGSVATYNAQGNIGGSVATYDGSGTYNAGTDAGKIATAAAVNTRQAKKTCAGWPDGAEHTDANCWLWNMPD